jgi:hypothetical protein
MLVQVGDLLHVGREASPQFGGDRALLFRVTVVDAKPTYTGWVWLTGYALDAKGEATARREIFVRSEGLRLIRRSAPRATTQPVTVPNRAPARPVRTPPSGPGSGTGAGSGSRATVRTRRA